MAERKSFLLRLPAELLDELNRWARDDLRSLNAQLEYLLREALRKAKRARDAGVRDVSEGRDAPPNARAGS
jgi:hypothetical protein